MADDAIVQLIEIAGIAQAVSDFTKLGEAGEQSFEKIEKGAQKAGGELGKAGEEGDKAGKKVARGAGAAGDSASQLQKVEGAAFNMGSALRDAGSAVGTFAGRLSVLGAAATAAIGGLFALAKSVSGAADGGAQSSKQLNLQLKIQSQILTDQKTRAVTNARAISELGVQFDKGKLSVLEYGDQLEELRRTQKNEAKDAEETAKIQAEANQKRLQDLAKLKAVKNFGADLAESLIKLGVNVEKFWKKFLAGPSLFARVVDVINQLLIENGDAIIGFYHRIIKAIFTLFDFKGGEADIKAIGVRFREFGEEVTVIIETIIVPAIRGFLSFVGLIASAINGIFGTNFSAQGLIFIAVIFKVIGGFKLLTTVITVFRTAFLLLSAVFTASPIGLLITALVLLGVVLLALNWKEVAKFASEAWETIKKKWNEAVKFFQSLWNLITAGASAAWQWVVTEFDKLVQWFKELPGKILEFLNSLWESIKSGFSTAWQWVKDGAQAFVDWFKETWLGKFIGIIQTAIGWVAKLFSAQKQVQDMSGGIPGVGGDGTPMARGGMVRGPGTSTSDSIWARLSKGEFVMKAAAVARYGANRMHAINQMRMPRFAAGGLVDSIQMPQLIPALAAESGSTRHTGRPIVLNIGGESFHMFSQDSDTAEKLGRFVSKRRVASAGRKQSHWGQS